MVFEWGQVHEVQTIPSQQKTCQVVVLVLYLADGGVGCRTEQQLLLMETQRNSKYIN